MPTSPETHTVTDSAQRDNTARCLLAYLEQLPMEMETRLELTLDVLRELPREATPEQALEALLSRLPTHDPEDYPPSSPPITREHMPAQYLGRRRSGIPGFASQWGWLLIVGLLLALTLLLHISQ
ncbi:hypothetical protein [Pseudodesulfovibrio sediminis]|uniref:Transmembrane anti-sigma factor n=1 Tax=Pseudodesulfovibrio sediminis TaxID=2810563 RepID=A0ABN6ES43_9BACT|nr:hypothetical protein [Pseudodesulfovibrio sediminis]BCS88060.1 hypothetical protein PSDVSF_13020 [Pseudodesulfovibrio sediminis]